MYEANNYETRASSHSKISTVVVLYENVHSRQCRKYIGLITVQLLPL